tara:strand:+ start:5901 stop:6881 length:981 start_codon:yes stop_codon:yes gene_type:complete
MIISKAPFRISFVGGGSDLPIFYKEYGGAVLSSSINQYIYILLKKRFEKGIRCSYSKTEIVEEASKLEHTLVRSALLEMNINDSLEIVSSADIPSSGTGLGSSSSFSVALINALHKHLRQKISDKELAEYACKLEIELAKNPIGKQDQYAAAIGGLKIYEFNQDNSVSVTSVKTDDKFHKSLNDSIITFYIGGNRDANKILINQNSPANNSKNTNTLKRMVNLVWDLKNEIEMKDIVNFGKILHENWNLKKTLDSQITNNKVDSIYNDCMDSGAIGGKLLGAGGGGFMVFIVPDQEVKNKIRKNLNGLREVEFNLIHHGAEIVYQD